MKIKQAKWITDPLFTLFSPIDIFHKEKEKNKLLNSMSHREALKNTHMLIRKVFVLNKCDNVIINITADDYYKLYINGQFVGQGPAPSYYFHYNVNQYDISKLLTEGENTIGVHVYYQGLINRVWNSGDYRMGLFAEIIKDGEVILVTDDTWKYRIADEFIGRKVIGYDTQFIEDIDNRKKIIDWNKKGFDDSQWEYAAVNEKAEYTLVPQITPNLQIYNIMPKTICEIEPGNLLIDFGKEITGRILVEASGENGQVITLHYGEELESDEKVRSNMRCNCRYIEKWILAGKDKDILENYDYKAFRYAQILSDSTVIINKEAITAEVRHYPFDESSCEFKSSDELLNKIWQICSQAVKIGTQEGYLDCPSREKGQYLGDALITGQAHAYLTGDLRIYKKCLTDFSLSAKICPGLMAVAPGGFMQEIADYSLQWPLQLLLYYELSDDIEFLYEMLPTAQNLIDYFKKFTRSDGLIENFSDKPVMVDWPSGLRDGYQYKLMPEYEDGCNTVLNAYYVGAVKAVNQMKDILGKTYEEEAEYLKNSFINAFYDKKSGLFRDSEISTHSSLHANVLPFYFELAPTDSSIIELIRKKRLSCGVYFSYFVMKALVKAGEYDFVYELLTCEDEHSWNTMIKEGATACFEAWGKDQKWNTSLCHPWAASPIIILIEDIVKNPPKSLEFMEITYYFKGKRLYEKINKNRKSTQQKYRLS